MKKRLTRTIMLGLALGTFVLVGGIDSAYAATQDEINQQVTKNTEAIGILQSDVEGLKSADNKLSQMDTALQNNINQQAGRIDTLNGDVDGLKNRVTALEGDNAINQGYITQAQQDIISLNTANTQNQQDIGDLKDQVEQNEKESIARDELLVGYTKENKDAIEKNTADIKKNASNIIEVNNNLVSSINDINKNMEDGFNTINGGVEAERQIRNAADQNLQDQIDRNAQGLTEVNDNLVTAVDTINKNVADGFNTINKNVYDGFNTINGAIAAEEQNRKDADQNLQDQIDRNAQGLTEVNSNLVTAVDTINKNVADGFNTINKNVYDGFTTINGAIDAETTNRIAADNMLSSRIDSLSGRTDKVGAGAAALAALHPLDYDADNKLSFASGVGNYAGSTAMAIGAFYRPNENCMMSLGGSMGNGENMVNLGVSFAIGSGKSPYASVSKQELIHEVNQMKSDNEAMKAEIEQLKAVVAELAAKK